MHKMEKAGIVLAILILTGFATVNTFATDNMPATGDSDIMIKLLLICAVLFAGIAIIIAKNRNDKDD